MNSPRTLESNIDAVVLKLVVMKKSRVETEVQFSVRFVGNLRGEMKKKIGGKEEGRGKRKKEEGREKESRELRRRKGEERERRKGGRKERRMGRGSERKKKRERLR